jgi:hypothetical protein
MHVLVDGDGQQVVCPCGCREFRVHGRKPNCRARERMFSRCRAPRCRGRSPFGRKGALKCRGFAIYCACQMTAEETSACTSHRGENAMRQFGLRPFPFCPKTCCPLVAQYIQQLDNQHPALSVLGSESFTPTPRVAQYQEDRPT